MAQQIQRITITIRSPCRKHSLQGCLDSTFVPRADCRGYRIGGLPSDKRIQELPEQALRHRLIRDAVAAGPSPIDGQVVSAEDPVQYRKMNREIDVDGLPLDPVMPVVIAWGDKDTAQEPKVEA